MRILERGENLRERLQRVLHDAAKVARVQVGRGTAHGNLPADEPAQRRRQRRNALGEYRRVRHDDHVARQPLLFAREKWLEVRGADFFFAFDHDFDVDGQLAVDAQVRLDRGDVHQALALVVDRAATVQLAVAHRRVERRRRPQLERVDRLHVVMAVDQHRRRAGCAEPLAVCHGVPGGLEHLGGEPRSLHAGHRVFGGGPHVGGVIRLRGDRLDGDPGFQLGEIALAVGANVIDEGIGVRGDHAAPFADTRLGCFASSTEARTTRSGAPRWN